LDVARKHHSYPAVRILTLRTKPAPRVDAMEILHKTQWQREQLVDLKKKLDQGMKVNAMRQKPFVHSPHYQDREWPMQAYAASICNEAVLDMLLAHGAEVDARAIGGPTALEVAAAQGSWIMVHALLDSKADVKKSPLALPDACKKGFVEIARLLLKAGADPNARYAELPLETAIARNDLDLLDVLLRFRADVNGTSNKASKPMLTLAWGKRAIVERLLSEKALDVNAATGSGTTALHLAARDGDLDMVRRLLDRGATVNSRSNSGTPLDFAVSSGHDDVVRLLKSRGGESGAK